MIKWERLSELNACGRKKIKEKDLIEKCYAYIIYCQHRSLSKIVLII